MSHNIDTIICEGLTDTLAFRTQATVTDTSAGTLALTSSSPYLIIFTGTTAGQIVTLPSASTVSVGYQQCIHNNSTQPIIINDGAGGLLITITTGQRTLVCLQVAGSTAGTWSVQFMTSEATSVQYTTLMQGLDDLQYVDGNLDIGHSPLGFLRGSSGTNAAVTLPTTPIDAASWGFMQFTTGTTATGRSWVSATSSALQLGTLKWNIEYRVKIPTLSTATQRFTHYLGFMNGTAAGQPTNGIYFIYSDNVNAGDWTLRTVLASTASTLDTNIPVVANTWYRVRFEYISSTLINCYIDDAMVGTIVSNIPSATNLYVVLKHEKSIGTTARLAYVDSMWWRLDR